MIKQDHGTPFNVAAAGTTLAIGIQAGVSNQTIYLSDISASSDAASGVVIVKAGTSIVWEDKIGSSSAYVVNLGSPISIGVGNTLTATTSGTAASFVNLSGFIVNNS